MNTYLVTWNPKNWKWTKLRDQAKKTVAGIRVHEPWSCGNTKRIKSGERLFLLKQGPDQPKGIMASGMSVSKAYEDKHWNDEKASQGEMAIYVDAEWEVILDPEHEPLLPVSAFQIESLPSVHWSTQKSGIVIPEPVHEMIEELWNRHVMAVRESGSRCSIAAIDPEEDEFPEGRVLYRLHRSHERSPQLVKKAKSLALRKGGRLACAICDFDFFKTYGSVGMDFIECHHVIPVSELAEDAVTKVSDIVLVCSNCHRMLHRRRPWLRLDDLRAVLATRQGK